MSPKMAMGTRWKAEMMRKGQDRPTMLPARTEVSSARMLGPSVEFEEVLAENSGEISVEDSSEEQREEEVEVGKKGCTTKEPGGVIVIRRR